MEAAAVLGRVVPRLRRPTRRYLSARAGERFTPSTPDHGRTRPNLATQCFGCRADKRKEVHITVTSGTRERAKRIASVVLFHIYMSDELC